MKKILKVIGITVLSFIALLILLLAFLLLKNYIDSKKPYIEDTYYENFQSDIALEKKYAGLGSYEVSRLEQKSEDDTIKEYRVWYPTELESKSQEYPLIVVTNASNMAASNYEPFFERLASWGFIVAGNEDRGAGSGFSTSKTLDYVLELNSDPDSIFHGKVSQDNIGVIGHSQGGAGAIRAVTEFDNSNKYKTIFTGSAAYPLLAKNMGWEYDISKVSIPYFMSAGTGSSDDSGEDPETSFGGVAPLSSLITNYDGITKDVFKVRARIKGAEHEDMLTRADGYTTAWMLYQLQDDEEAGGVFIGEAAEILSNSNWQDIEKNN
ncbi:poly(ethylene terephthalate) hydrolase family protein [Mesobacillus foraminis]|uniref:poly(ethylene terephthalate) hydrolase family protein n=1 Tax=Mesobacillus foraminis TaxID=279826 RepID=UPI0013CF2E7F|nr:alpha/beta hydrolase [Mesobacillus foraminis]